MGDGDMGFIVDEKFGSLVDLQLRRNRTSQILHKY
ncbi:hypothetical protein DAI22_09g037350 [Oryza sativa Japonica Group]|nr:hypothetical protein DAI22_09g037350 [Oryza sativa Japonica Group]